MPNRVPLAALTAILAGAVLPLSTAVGAPTGDADLYARVGAQSSPNAFQIVLSTTPGGGRVSHLDPGSYTIHVQDYATIHNFHLTGPGVNESTEVETAGPQTWSVTFLNGRYRYVCDAHVTTLFGTFTVGNVPPPVPKPGKLVAKVGPKRTISLKTAAGKPVRTLKAGRYRITVTDASKTDNFHLSGPGVNKKTPVAGTPKTAWSVTFAANKIYRFRSDAHPSLKGAFRTS